MVRPGSKVMRFRVDAATSAVRAVEQKTLQQLTKDGLPLGFKPAEQLGNLHSLFSRYLMVVQNVEHFPPLIWFEASYLHVDQD